MSPVDFTKYQPPAVYVSETASVALAGGFGQDIVVALVGEGIGSLSATDQLTLTATTPVSLSFGDLVGASPITAAVGVETGLRYAAGTDFVVTQTTEPAAATVERKLSEVVGESITLAGFIPTYVAHPYYLEQGTVVVKSTDAEPVTYVEDTDYEVDYNNGNIRRKGLGIADGAALVVDYDYCAIKSGHHVAITYDYVTDNYYDVFGFSDLGDVVDFYGQPLDSLGAIQSPLSLAAQFAFANGAGAILCAATEGGTLTDYQAAIAKLSTEQSIDIVVPISGDPTIHSAFIGYVTSQSANAMECRAILGRDGSAAVVPTATLVAAAAAVGSERVSLVDISTIGYGNPVTGAVDSVGGQYVAAAIAGIAASQLPSTPLTRKRLNGFHSLTERKTKAVRAEEARAGLMVIEDSKTGGLRIMHGLTTNVAEVKTREWSVVFAKDRIVQYLRETFDNIIGQPIGADTPTIVKAMAVGALEMLGAQGAGYIADYQDVKVRQNAGDPSVVEVKFKYLPVYPLNYINIQFSLDVSTGTVTVAE